MASMRTITKLAERTVKAEPPKAITLVAKTATVVLPDLVQPQIPNSNTDWGYEIAARYIFNDSGAKLYYAYGVANCDNVNAYHGAIADQTLFEAIGGQQVSVYSVGGGNISMQIFHRQDLHVHSGPQSMPAERT